MLFYMNSIDALLYSVLYAYAAIGSGYVLRKFVKKLLT